MKKQILSGGTDILADAAMCYYLLAISGKEKTKIGFLPTASGDAPDVIRDFYQTFSRPHFKTKLSHMSLFHDNIQDKKEWILSQDIIIVGGGQSRSMLGLWKEWEIDIYLKEAYEAGVILAGGSAGSVFAYTECLSDSNGNGLNPLKCLGFLPFSHCPHYRSEERRRAYKAAVLSKQLSPGYAVSDGAAIHFQDGEVLRAVHVSDDASTFWVDIDARGKEDKIQSTRLPSCDLMNADVQEELIWSAPAFRLLEVLAPEPENLPGDTKKESVPVAEKMTQETP